MSDKPKVFPAIGYSLLLLIAFVLAASLAGVAAGFVYGLLSVTPLLRAILSNITVTGGSFVALVGAFAGCSLTCWLRKNNFQPRHQGPFLCPGWRVYCAD